MDTRQADLKMLRQAARSGDPLLRKIAHESGSKISKESGAIKSMRRSLVREMRKGNIGNVKQIHHDIKNNPKYQNE